MGLLALAIAVPALVGLVLLAVPRIPGAAARVIGVGASLVPLACLVAVAAGFRADGGWQHVEDHPWIPAAGIRFTLACDGLALPLLLLTALLQPLATCMSAAAVRENERAHHGLLLLLEAAMLTVFCARDGFLFYVAFEATLLPMYFLIGCWGGPDRRRATLAFVLYTMAGSLPMLLALLWLRAGAASFAMDDLAAYAATLGPVAQGWCWLAFAVAFAVKLPLVPLHPWLPLAHVEAPTAGSMILAGVLLKLGGYGFLRIAQPWFPIAAADAAPWLAGLGVAGIVYGALLALVQQDVKRLVAYSSVSHLGACALGIATGTPEGYAGALFVMVAHGLGTGALFASVGVLYARRHTRDMAAYGGLAREMPLAATGFTVAALSSVGLPGLAGFVGEFLVLYAAFGRWPAAAAVAVCGTVLSAAYLLRAVRLVFLGAESPGERRDLDRWELAALAPALAAMVLLGVRPGLVLEPSGPTLRALAQAAQTGTGR